MHRICNFPLKEGKVPVPVHRAKEIRANEVIMNKLNILSNVYGADVNERV